MNGLRKGSIAAAVCIASLVAAGSALAQDESGWTLRVGAHYVDPKSNNHDVVSVDSGESLTFSATYRYTPRWAVEILGALPFSHDVTLKASGAKVAEVKHLPPTVTMQYAFSPDRRVRPYAGIGVNATVFFDEATTGPLAAEDLSLDPSFGLAAPLGLDIDIGENLILGIDARWIDIDSDAKLSGASLGTVEIDPVVLGLTFGWRLGR